MIKLESNIKEVDCALIFMLEEERQRFLNNNRDFIITKRVDNEYTEFIFFDKNLLERTGVMCAGGKKMGNTEACELMYRLSRRYKAHLYINLGVAGRINDVNIGDVMIADGLSTMGEYKANTTKHQTVDLYRDDNEIVQVADKLKEALPHFSLKSRIHIETFLLKLKKKGVELSEVFKESFTNNEICTGWCVTVPEVVKDKSKWPEFKEIRKINVIDMEAYYLALWHSIIKEFEPDNTISNSSFIVFKSVSDFGDINKTLMEECGSREIAMRNLYIAVSGYCTMVHDFSNTTRTDMFDYLRDKISYESLDNIVKDSDFNIEIFEEMFSNIVHSNDYIPIENPIKLAAALLKSNNQALLLKGRSGTGKSTFLSYLYKILSNELPCVLIDFSKFLCRTEISDIQIVALLKRLIVSGNKQLILIDGLKANSEICKEIENILDSNEFPNISYCIGNLDDDFDELCDIISGRKNVTEFYFYGCSVYSIFFNKYISDAERFLRSINSNIDLIEVVRFIKESKINSIDFRLLMMFANYKEPLSSKQNLHTFIKSCIKNKFTNTNLMKYWKNYGLADVSGELEFSDEYSYIKLNPYVSALSIATGVISTFTGQEHNEDEISQVLTRNYILSDDMNLLFEFILKRKNQRISIVNSMLKAIKNNNVSISTETQLLYSICRTINHNDTIFLDVKEYVEKRLCSVKNKIDENNTRKHYDYLIEYRTLCIIMNKFFDVQTYLNEFNASLLKDNDYYRCNLIFHLFYYSKREFDFNKIRDFALECTDYEMCCNTYFTLLNSLNIENDELIRLLVKGDPQLVLNLISILDTINLMLSNEIGFEGFSKHAKEALVSFTDKFKFCMSRLGRIEEYSEVLKKAESTLVRINE